MSKLTVSKSWMKRAFNVALLFVLSSAYMFAQQVKGTVQDASGEPLIGVNILEKGTSNGTVSRADGTYSINVAKGKTLVFSYIGYKPKEVTVKGATLNVYLSEDVNLLNEQVVVGYGTMQRKDVTSSITTVKAEDLNRGVFTDPAQMLQGKVPGLVVTSTGDPNGSPSITLRGASSLRTGEAMSPYYVIDGIPGVDISMVSPDDIESIDVLRDATATAIYGSKAANGVIIITTKSGKEGRVNVSYNAYVGFDNISKTLDVMDASGLKSLASSNGITLANDNGGNTDWQDEVMRTGVSHNHNVNINGGTEKTKYMASVNYMNRNGIVRGSDMSRLNVRSLVSTKILKDHLDISIGGNFNYGKYEGVAMNSEGASVMDAMNYYSPLNPIYATDGSWFLDKSSSKNYNPLSMINEDTGANTWKRQQFTAKATAHIIKGLDLNANYSFSNRQRTSSSYSSIASQIYEGWNGRANRNTYFHTENTFEVYANYDHTWNDIHKLGLMAGYSWEERVSNDGFGLTVYNFYDDYVKWNQLTYASAINGIEGVESGVKETIRNIGFYGRVNYSYASRYMIQATIRRDGSSVFGKDHRWGTFPSVSAAWNIAEENFMKNQDVISNLKLRVGYGVSGNALGFGAYSAVMTYGASGYFDYTADGITTTYRTLAATKNANADLKWESTGMLNVGIDYAFLGGRINGSIEFYNKKTKDLIWSYPVSTNIYPYGTINANVGEITNRGIEFNINADIVQNKNFRWNTTLNLSHNMNRIDKVSNDRFQYTLFTQGDPMVAGVSANGWTQRIMQGEALGTFFTYEFAGFDANGRATYYDYEYEYDANGQVVKDKNGNEVTKPVYNADGSRATTVSPELEDRQITGSAQPKLNIGWNNTFSWKNWSATVFFTSVIGNKIYNGSRANYMSAELLSNGKNILRDFASEQVVRLSDGSSKICTDANVPSDRWIENGSYLRLQTLTIGYTFRGCFNGWLKDLTVYGSANNLFTITGYKGLDPEVNMGGTDPGVDYRWSVYPHTRTYLLGVKVNF